MADENKFAFGKVASTEMGAARPEAEAPKIESMDDNMKAALKQAAQADIAQVEQTAVPPDSRQPQLADFVADNTTYPNVMERGNKAMEQSREQRGIETEPDKG